MKCETIVHTFKPRRAVFLDRDGTLIEDNGYIDRIEDVFIYPFTVDALQLLQKEFLLFIVTNQSGVGLGKISGESAENINQHVRSVLQSHGIKIQRIFCCSHSRDDACECIKPKPYFLLKAMELYNIDIARSYTIGDHPHDVAFGENAGATGLYVLTGHGRKHVEELPPGANIFSNLYDAALWILQRSEGE